MKPDTLRCESLCNPLAIEVREPRLSWLPPFDQAAYRVRVTQAGRTVWDSGRVRSTESLHIPYAGRPLVSRGRYAWTVRCWDRRGKASAWSAPAAWGMGILTPGWQRMFAFDQPHTEADKTFWIGEPEGQELSDRRALPVTYLRRGFEVKGAVTHAMLYATALGVYEARINGRRVGDQVLAPEWTDYRKRVQYQAYEVTALVRQGENVLAGMLGPGWYAGRIGMCAGRFLYGHRLRFLARLYVETADGGTTYVHTDGTWRVSVDGPIRRSELLDGEVCDARKGFAGWDQPGFDDSGWTPAGGEMDIDCGPLVAQPNEPIRITRRLTPVAMTEPRPGVYIADMGQNMVGWCRATFRGTTAGQTITLRHAEVLNADGTIYLENMRGASPVDTYVCAGAVEESFEPHFTYHGFRYVELTGLGAPPALTDVTGCVFHSDAAVVGSLETSSDLLNRIFHATQWTQWANMHSVPTDCPQRDERLGWMGDIQVFAQTAIFNMDMAAFFRKFLQDTRDAQAADGRFPDFAPHPRNAENRFSGNPGWADAGVIIPWRHWVNYGDKTVLAEQYDSMRRWVDHVDGISPRHLWEDFSRLTPLVYGDWLNADNFEGLADFFPAGKGMVNKILYATAFFAHSTRLLSQAAGVLGKVGDRRRYGALARAIEAAFNREFVKPNGRLAVRTKRKPEIVPGNCINPIHAEADVQAGYALALSFDLLPTRLRARAAARMAELLQPFRGHLSTGIQTTIRMMLELTRYGYHGDAYGLMMKTTMPSWGYMVEQGATTIWERWDGYVKGRGYQNPGMNSFNHYAIGAVGEWMYRTILGLSPDEQAPGWKRFVVRPIPGGGLTWAKGEYRSIRGTIRVEWHIAEGAFQLALTVPPNTEAMVFLPGAKRARCVRGGTHAFRAGIADASAAMSWRPSTESPKLP